MEAERKGVSRGGGHSYFESRDLRVGEYGFDVSSLLWGVRSQRDKITGGGLVDKAKCQGEMVLIVAIGGK